MGIWERVASGEKDFMEQIKVGDNFSNRGNLRALVRFRRESQPTILKDDFSSRTDPSLFTSIAPVLLDWSNKTS